MRERPLWIFIAISLLWAGCSGSKSVSGNPSKDQVINALTLFVEAVQESRFDKAFSYLTTEERRRMNELASQDRSVLERRLRALRLSTLANRPTVKLMNGKLEGIYEQLPNLGDGPGSEANRETAPEVPSF
jgi:hypothetical protein